MVNPTAFAVLVRKFRIACELLLVPLVSIVGALPPLDGVAQFGFPLAWMPWANCDPLHCVGAEANAVAVAAFPVVLLVMEAGRSEAAMARSPSGPVPLLGVARNSLAGSPVVKASVSVPDPVTGDPVTVNPVGALSPTLVTEPKGAHPVALPFARIPVGALPVEQSVGVLCRAVAVPALPV